MTAGELIKALRAYPKDAEVYIVDNWDAVDEDGHLTELREVNDVNVQRKIIDMGLDFEDITEILL